MKKLLCMVLALTLCLLGIGTWAEETVRATLQDHEYICAFLEDDTLEILSWWNRTGKETLIIPESLHGHSIVAIGYRAFLMKNGLVGVTIPDGVKTIGDQAFVSCPDLVTVTIPDSVTAIGRGAFYYCTHLASVNIPDSVTEIGKDAFGACYDLTLTVGRDSYAEQYCKDNGLNYQYAE